MAKHGNANENSRAKARELEDSCIDEYEKKKGFHPPSN